MKWCIIQGKTINLDNVLFYETDYEDPYCYCYITFHFANENLTFQFDNFKDMDLCIRRINEVTDYFIADDLEFNNESK